jgi:hypothetical protein
MRPLALAFAGFLLNRFGIPQENECLMGDLVEEYGSGRSVLWLWHQTANAIASRVATDIRDHKALAIRAVATGWALQGGWSELLILLHPLTLHSLQQPPQYERMVTFLKLWLLLSLCAVTLWPVFVGWVVGKTHRAQQAAMVLAYASSWIVFSVVSFSLDYAEIERGPVPISFYVGASGAVAISTLIGGFLQKPRPRQSLQTRS